VDAGLFSINASSGNVTFKATPNFEAPTDSGRNNVYDITVTASDGLLSSAPRAVAITVTNVNEAPSITSGGTASFAENATGTVYTATGSDADPSSLSDLPRRPGLGYDLAASIFLLAWTFPG